MSKSITKNIMYNTKDLYINNTNTIFILDWDDTLYPTSWTLDNEIDLTCPKARTKYISHFRELDKHLSSALKDMMKLGHILIITNAMPEWVILSSSVLPKTSECLKDISIISARERYQGKEDSSDWKRLTFKEELDKRINTYKYTNILSLGDAEYEYIALVDLYNWKKIPHKYLKSIKFIKSPDHNVLIQQIKIIKRYIPHICNSKRHYDLKFDTK
jgi:hypothetical protein